MTEPTEHPTSRPLARTGVSPAGFLERYERDRLTYLLDAAREFGPAVELAEGTVLLNDPPAVHDALRRTNTDFLVTSTIRRDAVSGLRGDPATDDWMRGRRAVQKGMSPEALREHGEWLAGEADRLRSAWRERGTVTDPVRDLEELTSRSFARFCFGAREVGGVAGRTGDLLNAITPIIGSPFQLPRAVRRLLPRYRRSVTAQRALEEELRRALTAPGGGGLVDSLLDAGLDTEATVRMLVASGLASYRVPAAALAWTLVALARHPDDADACAAGENVSWVVAESLRLWPPNWLILRTANGEQECGGWRLPAGAAVIISPYVVHRTAPTFADDDPLAFRPRRWESLRTGPGEYLPYGIGSRWCVGRALADLELTTILTRLATGLRFTVERLADRPDVRTTLLPRDLVLGVGAR